MEQIIALEGSGVLVLSVVAYCEARDALRVPSRRCSLGAANIGGLLAAALTIVLGVFVASMVYVDYN